MSVKRFSFSCLCCFFFVKYDFRYGQFKKNVKPSRITSVMKEIETKHKDDSFMDTYLSQ